MNEQKITVATRFIEVVLCNGTIITGDTFLQLHSLHHATPQTIGEILNSEEMFLPISGKDGVDLINLDQVVSVATAAKQEFDPLLELGAQYDIQVEASQGDLMQVKIYVNLPEAQRRVKDFLNQNLRFLHFVHQDRVLYIAKQQILRVKD